MWVLSRSLDRAAVFGPEFREDLKHWIATDRKLAIRLLALVEDALRSPFEGLGKPEPLKYELSGAWSRRLSAEHRLVYKVYPDRIEFLVARYHYGDYGPHGLPGCATYEVLKHSAPRTGDWSRRHHPVVLDRDAIASPAKTTLPACPAVAGMYREIYQLWKG